MIGDPKV